VVYISAIDQSGSLYKAGLRVNDVITRVVYNGKELAYNNASELLQNLSKSKMSAGSSLVVSFTRNKESYSIQVLLEQYIYTPPSPPTA
jgi:S1-C subfamily serine protease